jgi:ribosomal protein S18 acetylase RimI-like enzyme
MEHTDVVFGRGRGESSILGARSGVGKALIKEVENIARTAGSQRLYWLTAPDNVLARRLYDSLAMTDRVQYKILLA